MTKNAETVVVNIAFKGWKAVKDDALRVIKTAGSYNRLLAANPGCNMDNVQQYAQGFAIAALEIDKWDPTHKMVKDRFGTSLRAAIVRRDGKSESDAEEADVVWPTLAAARKGKADGTLTTDAILAMFKAL